MAMADGTPQARCDHRAQDAVPSSGMGGEREGGEKEREGMMMIGTGMGTLRGLEVVNVCCLNSATIDLPV
jgi:hypothetical protein